MADFLTRLRSGNKTNSIMTYDEFILTIENDEFSSGLPVYLQSLWYDAKGDWQKAHALIDSLNDKNSCWVHAYLHRKEGDLNNANYWYRRAGKPAHSGSVQNEWQQITMDLLLS